MYPSLWNSPIVLHVLNDLVFNLVPAQFALVLKPRVVIPYDVVPRRPFAGLLVGDFQAFQRPCESIPLDWSFSDVHPFCVRFVFVKGDSVEFVVARYSEAVQRGYESVLLGQELEFLGDHSTSCLGGRSSRRG